MRDILEKWVNTDQMQVREGRQKKRRRISSKYAALSTAMQFEQALLFKDGSKDIKVHASHGGRHKLAAAWARSLMKKGSFVTHTNSRRLRISIESSKKSSLAPMLA